MRKKVVVKALLLFGGPSLLAVACSNPSAPPAASSTPAAEGKPQALVEAHPAKGRGQIWAENCARCHSMRPPDWYGPAQWDVAVQHMRVRGYLTGQEARSIVELMQASK